MKKSLDTAKKNKNDEFYTQLTDIEKEVWYYYHYKDQFRGKVVYCNCDDYRWSNFAKYFESRFETFGLKKLIVTNYDIGDGSFKYEFDGENETITELKGDGDFRSDECIEILKETDIVVTNPPFSLFREYIAQLIEYEKHFIIIGNQNALTYKEIFPLIRDNKMWLGISMNGSNRYFRIPDDYDLASNGKIENEQKYAFVKGVRWFTNLEHPKRAEKYYSYRDWNLERDQKKYQKYDNCDAIEVSKSKDIPENYNGVMGVPITFLEKFNPNQFEIIGFRKGDDGKDLKINGKELYCRILIKWR